MDICGPCGEKFESKGLYVFHTCKASGKKPVDPEHLVKTTTPNFLEVVSKKALERGAEKAKVAATVK